MSTTTWPASWNSRSFVSTTVCRGAGRRPSVEPSFTRSGRPSRGAGRAPPGAAIDRVACRRAAVRAGLGSGRSIAPMLSPGLRGRSPRWFETRRRRAAPHSRRVGDRRQRRARRLTHERIRARHPRPAAISPRGRHPRGARGEPHGGEDPYAHHAYEPPSRPPAGAAAAGARGAQCRTRRAARRSCRSRPRLRCRQPDERAVAPACASASCACSACSLGLGSSRHLDVVRDDDGITSDLPRLEATGEPELGPDRPQRQDARHAHGNQKRIFLQSRRSRR
jgi:hypothetical protein